MPNQAPQSLPPDPDHQREAVALAYLQTDAAPRVIAKGRGLIAEEIISKAREHGIYVHESPELISLLMQVDLDDHIPSQLYLAVAELLAWLYRLESGESQETPPRFSLPVPPEPPSPPPEMPQGNSEGN